MESGSCPPSSKTQEKGRRDSTPPKTNSEPNEDLLESKRMRRQEQNRSSQRAFRLRKESHIRSLRDKLGELHNSHRNLCQSYSKKCEEVDQLNTYVSELTTEILQLQNSLSQPGSDSFPLELSPELDFCSDVTQIVDNTWRPGWEFETSATWFLGQ
ncbi:uncharacterized protein A1O9_11220 [Exophiala aquamarina CBS 119918]|uniref:BZIP domain-containing protein n=1 Tax=Exophiala aquamarina CBS 119918 TaxID=1182545 RepID=A0A072P0N6_9EURO|nr:uncharacterized protein A1O9_11220 [Exophiala aquamarina CBS 119918]KEF52803.1 hypothetical protein A1O9_11220 [Exophiala aquamarina CBS 119918]